jgi:hypothetical protein
VQGNDSRVELGSGSVDGGPHEVGRATDQPQEVGSGVRPQSQRVLPGLAQRGRDGLLAELDPCLRRGPLLDGLGVGVAGRDQRCFGGGDVLAGLGDLGQDLLRLDADGVTQGP